MKKAAVSAPRMTSAPLLHRLRWWEVMQQNISNSRRADRIICEIAVRVKEAKILGLNTFPLVDGADNVTYNRT